ncbi:layilin isoform X1 [Scyliorhinus torazame]|uniref:layilin isoform X1 n=1 Tax=Scyliorhinus torazame TaxID=75743 RepID=UPI003B5B251F
MPGCGAALLPVRCPGMESGTLLLLLLCLSPAASSQLLSGQNVCRRGVERPCYKIAYFHDVSHRLGFEEAWVTCQSDGGNLLSIETANEQQFIERLIQGLSAGDGDFWIGLWRRENGTQSLSDCSGLYQWLDGSDSKFRNWYVDEPSCGREVCVVMYHQPSASSGMGGPYLYQWNDDRCNMKNNFICKYAPVHDSLNPGSTPAPTEGTSSDVDGSTVTSIGREVDSTEIVDQSGENTLNILYIIIPTIPLLLLLLLISAVFCFRLFVTRRKERCEVTVKEHNFWMDPVRSSSPNLEVYSVIMKQSQADLTGARPHIKNTSFQTSPHSQDPDNVSRDYDNVAANCPSSGFVTNEIYEPYQAQVAMGRESGWVENEIYGY